MRRPGWLAAFLILTASASLMFTASAVAATSPEQQKLVAAYAPHLMLREQTDDGNCDTKEEQYNPPTSVGVVLDNPAVKLVHHTGGKDVTIRRGPTAAQIAGLGDDYYLDLPGDPLNVKCPVKGSYPKDFQALRNEGKAPPVAYAHIATEPGYTGLVVQYFFFYYFNQFNDVHEGDWEGMQISFDADTPAEALVQGPSQIALFQHAGGERANWDDTKVQKDGTHPIVYPAAGSHATFYDSAIYIQNGSHGSGVGCDNTSAPHVESDPSPVIVPTAAAPGSRFQWLSFLGHWGQREKGFNNGPQGPTTKRQWLRPFTWMNGIRQDSPRLPGGTILGPAPATAFCGAVAVASEFINLEAKTTSGAIGLALALLLLIVGLPSPDAVAARRSLGSAASLGPGPAASRRSPALRPPLADDASLRPARLSDPRSDPGPLGISSCRSPAARTSRWGFIRGASTSGTTARSRGSPIRSARPSSRERWSPSCASSSPGRSSASGRPTAPCTRASGEWWRANCSRRSCSR